MTRFPCTVCGECCRQVSLAVETQWLDRGDGICQHLDEKMNLCKIYQERPLICQIDSIFDAYRQQMTKSEFYRLNAECCNILQERAGLPSEFRVDLLSRNLTTRHYSAA